MVMTRVSPNICRRCPLVDWYVAPMFVFGKMDNSCSHLFSSGGAIFYGCADGETICELYASHQTADRMKLLKRLGIKVDEDNTFPEGGCRVPVELMRSFFRYLRCENFDTCLLAVEQMAYRAAVGK